MQESVDEAITPTDLINQDDFHCYAKLTLAGRRLPVFSLALDPPPVGDPAVAAQVRAWSRLRAARPLVTVEAALAQAAARYLPRHETVAAASNPSEQSDERPHEPMSVGELAGGFTGQTAAGATAAASARSRTAQRGRFGRRPRAGAPRSAGSSASVFDLWSDLLGDSAMPPVAAMPNGDAQDLASDAGGDEGGEEASP